jgi:uncharacterized protein
MRSPFSLLPFDIASKCSGVDLSADAAFDHAKRDAPDKRSDIRMAIRIRPGKKPMELGQPLSDAEFDELDQFLLSDATPEECMDIAMLDGFLTALVVGPNTLTPSLWLPILYGETDEDPMKWGSAEQAQRILGLIMRHMNDIIWQLREAPDDYEPVIYMSEYEGKTIPILDEWCTGFMQGVQLDAAAWEPLFDAEDAQGVLLPIMLYGTESGWDTLKSKPELAERHDEFAEALADCVLAIQDYWLPQRKAAMTLRREEPKTGRNEPCPCGSGKKFKKCCGDSGRLH